MRLRFSLRTLFILVTLTGVFCYVWLIRPTSIAESFARAISAEDYGQADRLFVNTSHQRFTESSEKRWAFRALCTLQPVNLVQLLTGRRHFDVHMSYFELDQMIERKDGFIATPRGVSPDNSVEITLSRIVIDRATVFDRIPR